MSDINSNIEKYIQKYCGADRVPGFAVMVSGEWGSGKSYLVSKVINDWKDQNKNRKSIFVSLYGLTSVTEIADAIFANLHPILSNSGVAMAGRIVRGLLKSTVQIDLNNDGRKDVTIKSPLEDMQLPEFLKNPKDNIIIFDDLERCGIKPNEVLGFINGFVEHQSTRVIIICNEAEIIADEKDLKKFQVIKEKLIGKTVEVKPNFEAAWAAFVAEIQGEKYGRVKQTLTRLSKNVKILYEESKSKNLRSIRQIVWDFCGVYTDLESEPLTNKDLELHFTEIFFALSLEIKAGGLDREDFIETDGLAGRKLYEAKKRIESKYERLDLTNMIFEDKNWFEILFDRGYESKKLVEKMKKSKYFATVAVDSWKLIWEYINLSEESFNNALDDVLRKFRARKYAVDGEILHVAGILMFLSEAEIIEESAEEIYYIAVDNIKLNTNIDVLGEMSRPLYERNGWDGLAFHSSTNFYFKNLRIFLRDHKIELLERAMPIIASKFISDFMASTPGTIEKLEYDDKSAGAYFRIPILSWIAPWHLAQVIVGLEFDVQEKFFKALKNRYGEHNLPTELLSEKDWAIRFVEEIASFSRTKSAFDLMKNRWLIENYAPLFYDEKKFFPNP